MGTAFWLLLWLVVITVFALSNSATVTVRFWQWTIVEGAPLGAVVVGAGVLGALMTYAGSFLHHLRQAQQIRSLQHRLREHEARQSPPPAG